MTQLLDTAIVAARRLPDDAQNDIARLVLRLASDDAPEPIALTADERAAIETSLGHWRLVEVGLIRCGVVKALVRSVTIVEVEISADRAARLADAFVGSQIHLLVFDAAPQPLDEHVVAPGALAIPVQICGAGSLHCAANQMSATLAAADPS